VRLPLCGDFLAVVIARSLSKPLVQITVRPKVVTGRIDGHAFKRRPGRSVFSFRDVRRDGNANRAKAALLENTIESITISVLVADEHGQIVVANAAAKRLLEIVPGAGMTRKLNLFLS